MQNPTSDCSELLRKTAATFSDDTLLQLFLTVQQNNVALSIEYAIKRITELSFQVGSYSKKRKSGGRWLRTY
ncbi:uncharacterized protein LACBIDRAFT_318450 [Laccaria bicolor S238N-H82]|uniref:Predicted protein n=1 Tax=Laccaria bicolor (strain S238N-H82 / ATCC MYA-4686) TaxID=486041 RepID=B0DWJ7_LACBS|nr:uncharacterized protein LACBIDRAFT_312642 [Laccaria bicolor S238N-H82]XP_001890391.1 uncharacterized protein LACBIDRAFT_318450 [Laccaria bicolor S238N-H82]EDQ98958.1 predicted protein [Laccaria bicolor S238N-H82]EDR01102.1 predicted protein [Laccaria bicolor S238N-H82]|eukprot:XP_001888321.1 predicted protein [Laccaria bicolor S238N-H82]